ncbi:hypothetical protein PSN45_004612 [Yamadazyma tenuis]|nr:hypothetical protein PSN45_004612 [Yamadazyma tenuis]
MSLTTNKQQELIDESINEYISTYDKVASQYLHVRKQILELASGASKNQSISPADHITIKKLQFELDTVWGSYSGYLHTLENYLDISKHIQPSYVDELSKKYEKLLVSKLSLTKTIRNIKEVQIPLIEEMKELTKVFQKNLSRTTTKRYPSKAAVENALNNRSKESMKVDNLIVSRSELHQLFDGFDEKVRQLEEGKEDTSRSIKASYYINKELESGEKFLALDDDKYLFQVSKINYQDSYLANASVAKYDELNDQLVHEIADLIAHSTSAKRSWIKNAAKIDAFKAILEEDIEMADT